ncbi:hypothetical protein AYX22_14990 [Arthrobacter sp. D5-1]|nr:hypothetical protein AYX22_14990 [Arthrobacter sp. D5-1]
MARYRITVTQVIEIEQENLQAAAIGFPTVLSKITDPDMRMALASDPEQAALLLSLELYDQALMVLPGAQVRVPPEFHMETI